MRRSFIVATTAIASAVAFAACVIDTSGLSGGAAKTSPDAGASDATPPETISGTDAATDATRDAASTTDGCVPVISQRDAGDIAPLAAFDLVGTAAVDGTEVVLTANQQNLAGALWSSSSATFAHFDMTAGFRIEPNEDRAETGDGFGFAWINQASLPSAGVGGAEMSIQSLPGFGVVIDEYGEGYSVPPPVVAVVDLTKQSPSAWSLSAVTLTTPILDDLEHFLHVTFESGVVTVHVDDELAIDRFVIPGYASYQGRWGFGAGTGGATAGHRLTRVSFVDPSTSCH